MVLEVCNARDIVCAWSRPDIVLGGVAVHLGYVYSRPLFAAAAAARRLAGALGKPVWTTWPPARQFPGSGVLITARSSVVNSVSCASEGNCAVGGFYADSAGRDQAFVASEVRGSWHSATGLPGMALLNLGGSAQVNEVSCGSAGNCTAGGYYHDKGGNGQAFVASEVNGTWRAAIEVRGTAGLNVGGDAGVSSVSCASAGNCVVGGWYGSVVAFGDRAFVASEVNGTWDKAVEVPGTAALNTGGYALVNSVSCATAGNCTAGGSYHGSRGHFEAFAASEVNGTWRTAIEVPGTAGLNTGGNARVDSVSCASAGNCTIDGTYFVNRRFRLFVAEEVKGVWQPAIRVSGPAALGEIANAPGSPVACASAGNCAIGGDYLDIDLREHALVASEVNGTWQNAIEVPGTAALNTGSNARANSVSCGSAGDCTAGGYYTDNRGRQQAFVAGS